MGATTSGTTTRRQNQRNRTRKDLLLAAARLSKQGQTTSLEEIAREALVSRATAYRYFPNIEALLVEAALDVAVPDADTVFADGPANDPVARLERVDTLLHDLVLANEPAMRTMLVHTLQRGMKPDGKGDIPVRQNRRMPLIEAALAPARQEFKPAALKTLSQALALIMGTEAMVVVKDVLQLSDTDARKVKRWAIRALVQAARKSA
jgi:AcrR family transcriptional regulator